MTMKYVHMANEILGKRPMSFKRSGDSLEKLRENSNKNNSKNKLPS
jgi:hypothetical protein